MILVSGSARVHPDKVREATALAQQMTAFTRTEPGCLSTGYYVSIESPQNFFLFQVWKSEEALSNHYRQEHTRQFLESLPQYLDGETAVRFLNRYDVLSRENL
jgi:quinol monooxygenase YgiN